MLSFLLELISNKAKVFQNKFVAWFFSHTCLPFDSTFTTLISSLKRGIFTKQESTVPIGLYKGQGLGPRDSRASLASEGSNGFSRRIRPLGEKASFYGGLASPAFRMGDGPFFSLRVSKFQCSAKLAS